MQIHLCEVKQQQHGPVCEFYENSAYLVGFLDILTAWKGIEDCVFVWDLFSLFQQGTWQGILDDQSLEGDTEKEMLEVEGEVETE